MPEYANKFDAGKEFQAGVEQAMFPGSYGGGYDKSEGSPFMDGYHYGASLKASYYDALNQALGKRGIEQMQTVHLCHQPPRTCLICGEPCLVYPDMPSPAFCPEHCPDHDYRCEGGETLCVECGAEPPEDWGRCADDVI